MITLPDGSKVRLCARCESPTAKSKAILCPDCRAVCTCGQPRQPGSGWCSACWQKHRKGRTAKRLTQPCTRCRGPKEPGNKKRLCDKCRDVCTCCGKPAAEGKAYCAGCAQLAYTRLQPCRRCKKPKDSRGILCSACKKTCSKCGKNPPRIGDTQCRHCGNERTRKHALKKAGRL